MLSSLHPTVFVCYSGNPQANLHYEEWQPTTPDSGMQHYLFLINTPWNSSPPSGEGDSLFATNSVRLGDTPGGACEHGNRAVHGTLLDDIRMLRRGLENNNIESRGDTPPHLADI